MGPGFCLNDKMVPDYHVYVFPFESLRIATSHCAHPFMYIASPIPIPTQVLSSKCFNIIASPVRSVNYILILPFYTGQFPICSLEFVYMVHRHRLATVSLMSVQAYKYCESRCSGPSTDFFPDDDAQSWIGCPIATSFDSFFSMASSLYFHDNRTLMNYNRNTLLHLLDISICNECNHHIYPSGASLRLWTGASDIVITVAPIR